MPLNFKEAKAKLKETADGKYHFIRYGLVEFVGGRLKPECAIYIDGEKLFYSGETWEEAFSERERILEVVKQKTIEAQMP